MSGVRPGSGHGPGVTEERLVQHCRALARQWIAHADALDETRRTDRPWTRGDLARFEAALHRRDARAHRSAADQVTRLLDDLCDPVTGVAARERRGTDLVTAVGALVRRWRAQAVAARSACAGNWDQASMNSRRETAVLRDCGHDLLAAMSGAQNPGLSHTQAT